MKDYTFENGHEININLLEADFMSKEEYVAAHKGLPVVCHDVFIEIDGGILFVKRLNVPAKNILWPIGGRVLRGVNIIDSLKDKVMKEAGLDIFEITEVGTGRTMFETDPFGHGKGTDTINFYYFAKAKGNLKLDEFHEKPTIMSKSDYNNIKDSLHSYVRDCMDKIINLGLF